MYFLKLYGLSTKAGKEIVLMSNKLSALKDDVKQDNQYSQFMFKIIGLSTNPFRFDEI